MNRKGLPCFPSLLNRIRLAQVFDLAYDVQFAKAIEVCLILERSKGLGLIARKFPYGLNPLVNHAKGLTVNGVLDAATAVMTAQNDVLYFEREDGVMED